jgi:Ribbon-helix-helix protein, copG family
MATQPIKLPEPLDRKLTAIAKKQHSTRAKVLREALEAYDKQTGRPTVEALGADLIGSLQGPGDLLSNPKRMSGYGR